ncbi:MAG: hypothetical protein AB7F64_05225, partial [Gammaproteobacteria bacterium]
MMNNMLNSHLATAKQALARQDYPGVIKAFEQAKALDESHPQLWLSIGEVLAQSGFSEAAKSCLDYVLRVAPQDSNARQQLAALSEKAKKKKVLEGHTDSVRALAVLPSGEVVSGSDDNTLRVWNPKTGQCRQVLQGHTDSVYALTVLPGGEVVSGSRDKTLRVWNPNTGQCLQVLKGHTDSVYALTVLPCGEVVCGSLDNTLRVWNPKSGQCLIV